MTKVLLVSVRFGMMLWALLSILSGGTEAFADSGFPPYVRLPETIQAFPDQVLVKEQLADAPFKVNAEGSVEIKRGRHYRRWFSYRPGEDESTPDDDDGIEERIHEAINSQLTDSGWEEVYASENYSQAVWRIEHEGKMSWLCMTLDAPQASVNLELIEEGGTEPVFEHHPPAADQGRIDDREDIPFLTPYPRSVLIGGGRRLGPLDLTILASPGVDAPLAGTAVISRNYNGPSDLTRLQFIRENYQAFIRAGWTVAYPAGPEEDSGVIIAHYDKDSLDVWARLTYDYGAALSYSTTDPSPDDWKTMLRQTCRLPLYGIVFDFNKATLRPESAPVLDRAARLLNEDSELVIEVQGHTDNIGSDAYNLKLSEARAGSVRQWLVDHRVDSARLSSVGYGKQMPVADNNSDFGRAQNRRVELKRRECKPSK